MWRGGPLGAWPRSEGLSPPPASDWLELFRREGCLVGIGWASGRSSAEGTPPPLARVRHLVGPPAVRAGGGERLGRGRGRALGGTGMYWEMVGALGGAKGCWEILGGGHSMRYWGAPGGTLVILVGTGRHPGYAGGCWEGHCLYWGALGGTLIILGGAGGYWEASWLYWEASWLYWEGLEGSGGVFWLYRGALGGTLGRPEGTGRCWGPLG